MQIVKNTPRTVMVLVDDEISTRFIPSTEYFAINLHSVNGGSRRGTDYRVVVSVEEAAELARDLTEFVKLVEEEKATQQA